MSLKEEERQQLMLFGVSKCVALSKMTDLTGDRSIYKLQALTNVMASVMHSNGKKIHQWSKCAATAQD